ncbi:MAG: Adenosylcobinamide-phosphate guanylyltransferase [Nitrosopumilus sp.]|nr:Adenosylcobinamide-phosphate guanylyltransferase [Nitrosopumilus sp.]
MIGLVMAGGKGTRMNLDDEKLLLVHKKPIILQVVESLKNSKCFSKILAITSPNSPNTKKFLQEKNVDIFNSSGIGFVEDLNSVLKIIDDDVFVTSGDLPLLNKKIIQKIVNQYNPQKIWTSVLVTDKFLISLGLESNYFINFENQKCHYSGISLINSKKITSLDKLDENYVVIDDKRVAFNLNTKNDYNLLSTT